jgi:hypothetical protein
MEWWLAASENRVMKKPEVPYGVHVRNAAWLKACTSIRDTRGKPAVKPFLRLYLEKIGTYSPDNGCYLTDANLLKELGQVNKKTCRTHEKYAVEVLKAVEIQHYRDENGMLRKRRIPVMPIAEAVEPQAEFNKRHRNSEDEMSENDEKNLVPDQGEIHPHSVPNLSEGVVKEVIQEVHNNHLKSSFDTPVERPTPSACEVAQTAGRPGREAAPRAGGENFIVFNDSKKASDVSGDDWLNGTGSSEPLETKRKYRGKQPKTQFQRRAANEEKIRNGHCANPIGGPSNKLRQMRRERNALPPSGNVTRSKLWNHLCDCYEAAYGPGVVEELVPCDPSGFDAWIGEIKQTFIDRKQYDPSMRDLASYFTWVFNPENAAQRLQMHKKAQDPAFVRLHACKSGAYVIAFYDRFLRKKKDVADTRETPAMERAQHISDFVSKAYDAFTKSREDDRQAVYAMVNFGYVLYAQYLHDTLEMSESECKKRIIELLARYLRGHSDPKRGKEVLEKALRTTQKNEPLYDEDFTVFKEWATLCPSIITTAIEQSGV